MESFTSQYSSVPRLKMLTALGGLLHRQQDRVHAVLHVQVRLALRAVAQHVQLVGMRQQLLVEIEDVAVGVALAQDRDEAEDVALEAEAFAIGRDQAFGRPVWRRRRARSGSGNGASSGVGITVASP